MNKKLMAMGVFLFAALVLGIPSASFADEYAADNLTIQVGTDETELSFAWLTTDSTVPTLVVCKEAELEDGACPTGAINYKATIEEVLAEEESSGGGGGGPGGGGPPGATDSDTVQVQDEDTEEEEVVTYACKVTVNGLESDVTYAYTVGYEQTFTAMSTFATKGSDNYNFIFVGDPQIGASRNEDSDAEGWATTVTAALTKFENTSFILSAGDQVEDGDSDTQYDGFFSAEELTSMPLAPANGNHDKNILYAYHFNVPNESELGQMTATAEDGETALSYGGDYWFTYGKALFMVINTNNSSATSHSEFLAEAIGANSDAKWKVVVFHHSLYSSAKHVSDVADLRTSLVPVMDEHDIDVVLAGHDHFYARTYPLLNFEPVEDNSNVDTEGRVIEPDGTVYFTADSASGSKYYDFSEIEGYTNYYLAAYSQPSEPSYLNVEVKEVANGDTFTVSSYLTASGEQIDTYTILKPNYNLDSDEDVDLNDLKIVRSHLRKSATEYPAADFDGDGSITVLDARKLIVNCTNSRCASSN